MTDLLTISTGGLTDNADRMGTSPSEILRSISALSGLCVAPSGGSGLTAAYSEEYLRGQLELPASRLALCHESGGELVGFALYHVDPNFFPPVARGLPSSFLALGRIAYAQVIAVHPQFRGSPWNIYNATIAAVLADTKSHVDAFVSLVRVGNDAALSAHKKRGWLLTTEHLVVEINGRSIEFQCLLYPLCEKAQKAAAAMSVA